MSGLLPDGATLNVVMPGAVEFLWIKEGPPGEGLRILGVVANEAALPGSSDEVGDAYVTNDTGHLWVWDGGEFNDVGPIRGPANPAFTDMVYDGDDLTSWDEDGITYTATYEDGPDGERRVATLEVGGTTRTFTYDGEGRMTGAT